jgi:hypothetical protein
MLGFEIINATYTHAHAMLPFNIEPNNCASHRHFYSPFSVSKAVNQSLKTLFPEMTGPDLATKWNVEKHLISVCTVLRKDGLCHEKGYRLGSVRNIP